ncbi:MAG: response regulator [Deltaproteobacteria bacterium]|jgi:DNA-binding response OmpR family regulator|nr:response regulator [Deltaproteobacteria bacterium]
MNAKIMLMVADPSHRAALSAPLAGKYALSEAPAPDPAQAQGPQAEAILAAAPDVVVMDYRSEDALSVKILQEVSDRNDKISFIFIDTFGKADRESVLMAINEGVQAFIDPGIQPVALLNYVSRVLRGPSRLRPVDSSHDGLVQSLNERLTVGKTRLNNAEKLITYLLSTPLSVQPRRALILSDSAYQRELLKKQMEDNNFVVLTAPNIADGVALTISEKPRIIISDYELEEGKTGIDFCRELKFVHKITPIYFVICTANQDKIPSIMSPGNGVDDCLQKPATPTALNEFLARVALGLII